MTKRTSPPERGIVDFLVSFLGPLGLLFLLFALETHGIDEAIWRARLYKEAAADVLFVEGPRSKDELRRIGAELPDPLTVNLIEGGRTPMCSLDELAEMGFFSVGFVLSGLYATARALERTYAQMLPAGITAGGGDAMMDFDEFNELLGLEDRYKDDDRYSVGRARIKAWSGGPCGRSCPPG